MCCRYVELPKSGSRWLSDDEVKSVQLHPGLEVIDHRYFVIRADLLRNADILDRTIRYHVDCSALAADGSCSLYETPERPKMCEIWPDAPGQAPDGCLYNDALVGAESR